MKRAQLMTAFATIGEEAKDPNYFEGANDEDVHTFVIRKLGEKVGALVRQDSHRPQPQ